MITQELDIFFCKQGYLRLASGEYSLDDTEKFRHLTNNSLQKYSKNYQKETDIISPKLLEKEVRESSDPTYNFEEQTVPEIVMIVRLLGLVLLKKRQLIFEREKELIDKGPAKTSKVKWVCECGKTFDKEKGIGQYETKKSETGY
jgi:transposase-like protein